MPESRRPAPHRWRLPFPSLLLVAALTTTALAADNKPLDVFIPPLVARNTPPLWDLPADSLKITGGDTSVVRLHVIDPDGSDIQISTFAMPEFVALVDSGNGNGSLIITPPTLFNGRFSMLLIAIDDSSSADTSDFTIIVSRLNRPPVWQSPETDSVTIMEGKSITVRLTANDVDGDYLYALVLGAFAPVVSSPADGTFDLRFAPEYGSAGVYILTVVVSDLALADSLNFRLTVTPAPPNHPPVWSPPDADSVGLREGELGLLQVQVTDEDGDLLNVSTASEVPVVLSATGDGYYDVFIMPEVGDTGRKTVTLVASDGRDSDTLDLTVQVFRNPNQNHAPTFVAPPINIQLNVNRDTTIAIRATDSDLDDLRFSGFYLPSFVAIVGRPFPALGDAWADIHISPGSAHQGVFPVYFVVSDGELKDTTEVWITITNINFWPEIGEIPARTMNEGDTLEIEIVASDANGTTVALSAFSVPAGATFVDHRNNRATFRFLPTYAQAGQYRVGFIANDGSLRDTVFLDITVLNTPRPPQLVNVASKTVNEGSVIRIPLSATDPDNDPITLSSVNFPEHAVLTDSGNGKGDITFAPVLGQIGPFELTVLASDGVRADTMTILVTVLQVSVPPDSVADVDFITEQVAKYVSQFAIDQIHTEDLDLDGIDEVLFRENVDGGHVLRIWSVAGDSLWVLPPVGMGIKSYTLRAQGGLIEPVVWTNGNELLGLAPNRGGWELLATVPDSVARIQWLPDNPAGALALGMIAHSSSGYSESPMGCTSYSSNTYSSSLLLTRSGTGVRWTRLGYAQVAPFDFGSALPVFEQGIQSDLFVFTFADYSGHEAWGNCGNPNAWSSVDFALASFTSGFATPAEILTIIDHSCDYLYGNCVDPNQYQYAVGLSRWNDLQETGLKLCFAGRPGINSPYRAESAFRMTVLNRDEFWTATEAGFNLGTVPSRGGILSIPDQGQELMLLAADAGLGYLLTIPDAQVAGRLQMPAAGRFKTGYVLDTTNRDMVFKVLDGISIYRVKPYVAPRDTALVHHVPGDFETIQDAINAALSGDTIVVAPGTYRGSIDFLGKDICLKSSTGAASTFILPASTTRAAVRFAGGESEDAILDGFTIRLSSTTMVAIENEAKPTIRNNIFREQQGSGDVITIKSKGALITRNIFAGNTNARCIAVEASGSARIVNNTFDRNGRGIYSLDSHTVVLNNVITRHAGFGLNGRFGVNDYNDVWQNNPNYEPKYGFTTGPGVHDISLDPELRDPFGYDYRLTDLSYCVDAGDPDEQYADPDGSIADLGAFQLAESPRPGNLAIPNEDRWHVLGDLPMFTWTFFSEEGHPQDNYDLVVRQIDPPATGIVWIATGESEKSLTYAGPPLIDGVKYSYTISATDDQGPRGYARSFFRMNARPAVPAPLLPADGQLVNVAPVRLVATSVAAVDADTISYDCELFDDAAAIVPIASFYQLAATDSTVSTPTVENLVSGGTYYWAIRAYDGWEYSSWSERTQFTTRAGGILQVPEDFLSIGEAIAASGHGDTILVGPGGYRENVDFGGRALLLTARAGRDSTILIAAESSQPVVRMTSDSLVRMGFEGFTVQNGLRRSGVYCERVTADIRDCRFDRCVGDMNMYEGGGITMNYTRGSIVIGNVFQNCGKRNYGSGAVYLRNCDEDTLAYNVSYGNLGYGAVLCNGGRLVVFNNTLHVKDASGIYVHSGARAHAFNNIIVGAADVAMKGQNTTGAGFDDAVSNCLYGNYRDFYNWYPAVPQMYRDPLFVDTAGHDYRLRAESPCIDAGDTLQGIRDPDGTCADIGALPFGGLAGGPYVFVIGQKANRIVGSNFGFGWSGLTLGTPQDAFQIQVGTDLDWIIAETWNPAFFSSAEQQVMYSGPPPTEGRTYFYRVRTRSEQQWSAWVQSSFYANASPEVPIPIFPALSEIVPAALFYLIAQAPSDPEGDPATIDFEVYADFSATDLAYADPLRTDTGSTVISGPILTLAPERSYWWRIRADDGYSRSPWSGLLEFRARKSGLFNVPSDFATIPEAVGELADGDTLLVAPGTYYGGFGFQGKALRILSTAGPLETEILLDSGETHYVDMTGIPGHAELTGFTFRGGRASNALSARHSRATIRSNIFTGHASSVSTVEIGDSTLPLIEYNLFHDNQSAECIGLHHGPARIVNNTFYDNPAAFFTHWPGAVAINNIVVSCSTYAVWGAFDTADYNVLWENVSYDSGDYNQGPHDILADPMFVNPAVGDFRLAAGSPCIDAGHPDPQYNDPDGSRNDIGAFPFVPGVSALHPDDYNGDGTVDVRDAVRLIDLAVRKSESGEATGTSDQSRVRGLIRRIWGAKEARK